MLQRWRGEAAMRSWQQQQHREPRGLMLAWQHQKQLLHLHLHLPGLSQLSSPC